MSAFVEADEQGIMRSVNAQWPRAAEQYACRMQKYVWRNRIASEREKTTNENSNWIIGVGRVCTSSRLVWSAGSEPKRNRYHIVYMCCCCCCLCVIRIKELFVRYLLPPSANRYQFSIVLFQEHYQNVKISHSLFVQCVTMANTRWMKTTTTTTALMVRDEGRREERKKRNSRSQQCDFHGKKDRPTQTHRHLCLALYMHSTHTIWTWRWSIRTRKANVLVARYSLALLICYLSIGNFLRKIRFNGLYMIGS